MASPLAKKIGTIICASTLSIGLTACSMNIIDNTEAKKAETERIEAEQRETEQRAAEQKAAEEKEAEKKKADKIFDEVTLYKNETPDDGVAVIGGPFRYHPGAKELSARYADITLDCTDFNAASDELDKILTEYESDIKFDETATLPGPKSESSYQQRFVWVNVPESNLDKFLIAIRKNDTLEINDIYDQYFDGAIAQNVNDVLWKTANDLYRKTKDAESEITDETNQTLLKNQTEFLKNFKDQFYDDTISENQDTNNENQTGYSSVNIALRSPVQ